LKRDIGPAAPIADFKICISSNIIKENIWFSEPFSRLIIKAREQTPSDSTAFPVKFWLTTLSETKGDKTEYLRRLTLSF
jgi:hypothetical protein